MPPFRAPGGGEECVLRGTHQAVTMPPIPLREQVSAAANAGYHAGHFRHFSSGAIFAVLHHVTIRRSPKLVKTAD